MSDVDLSQLAIDRSGGLQARARRRLLTRYVLPGVLIIGFLALVAWAAWDLLFPPTSVRVVPVFATQAEVQQAGTPLFKAAGWIEPRPTPVRVAALAPGVVEQLLVVEDQTVRAGEPIAELVKDDARLEHDRALANLALREAERAEARASLTAATTRLEQPVHLAAALAEAEASLAKIGRQLKNLPFEIRRAQAELEVARKDHDGKAAADGVVAGVEIDKAKGALDVATALVEELTNRADSLRQEHAAQIQRRDALKTQRELLADELQAKQQAEAKVKAATARVEQAAVIVAETRLQLDRMTVRSPIDGRVFRLVGHPGARLSTGMGHTAAHDASTVVTMYRPDLLQVRVDVRFEDLPKVILGQPVRIENPALKAPLTGKVLLVSSEADIQKNTLQVKVEIPSPPAVFKPEMLVDVTFVAAEQPGNESEPSRELRLYLPRQAVQQGADGPFVWLADQSAGVARKTAVRTGVVGANGLIEVTAGLTISSRIIVTGTDRLRDGERIRVLGEETEL